MPSDFKGSREGAPCFHQQSPVRSEDYRHRQSRWEILRNLVLVLVCSRISRHCLFWHCCKHFPTFLDTPFKQYKKVTLWASAFFPKHEKMFSHWVSSASLLWLLWLSLFAVFFVVCRANTMSSTNDTVVCEAVVCGRSVWIVLPLTTVCNLLCVTR